MPALLAWVQANKLIIAVVSLIGGIAGIAFTAADISDELEKKRLKDRS
jgi:hypothetical protein